MPHIAQKKYECTVAALKTQKRYKKAPKSGKIQSGNTSATQHI